MSDVKEAVSADDTKANEWHKLLEKLKRGDCWCEVGIGNPMMRGQHSLVCLDIQKKLGVLP